MQQKWTRAVLVTRLLTAAHAYACLCESCNIPCIHLHVVAQQCMRCIRATLHSQHQACRKNDGRQRRNEQQPDPPTHVLLVQVVSESPQVLAAKEDVPVCLGVVLDGPAHVACSHTDMHAFRYQGTAGSAWIRMSIAWVHNRLLYTDRSSQAQPGTACTQETTSCHKSV